MRQRGPIVRAGIAFFEVPVDPTEGALSGDPHLLSHVSHRPLIVDNSTNKQPTAMTSQTSISVRHDDLLAVKTSNISTKTGGPPLSQAPTRPPRSLLDRTSPFGRKRPQ